MRTPPFTFVPRTASGLIDWEGLARDYPFFAEMAKTPQCEEHHGEGDVLTHSKMVAAEAETLADEHGLPESDRDLLVAGAVFHDCGKPTTLTMETGIPSSPKHAAAGTNILRQIWWERGWFPHDRREQVLSLVRFHAAPVRLLDPTRDPAFQVIQMSWMARNDILALLAEADMRGRISRNGDAQTNAIETAKFFGEYAKELGCFSGPRAFPTGLARFHYFATNGLSGPDYAPFDDSVGEAIIMCGLPASGKNTWVEKNVGDSPIVELDGVRRQMDISPEENQGLVVQAAKEQARVIMRKKAPRFIWNATNLRVDLRRPLISLFTEYGYRVRIVYCPADRPALVARNQRRPDETRVPIAVIDRLGPKLEPPRFTEAPEIETVWTA